MNVRERSNRMATTKIQRQRIFNHSKVTDKVVMLGFQELAKMTSQTEGRLDRFISMLNRMKTQSLPK